MILVTAAGKNVYQGSDAQEAQTVYESYVERTHNDKQWEGKPVLLYVNNSLLFAHNLTDKEG